MLIFFAMMLLFLYRWGFDVEVMNDVVDLFIDFIAVTCAAICTAVHCASVGFCPATYGFMLAPSLEVERIHSLWLNGKESDAIRRRYGFHAHFQRIPLRMATTLRREVARL